MISLTSTVVEHNQPDQGRSFTDLGPYDLVAMPIEASMHVEDMRRELV